MQTQDKLKFEYNRQKLKTYVTQNEQVLNAAMFDSPQIRPKTKIAKPFERFSVRDDNMGVANEFSENVSQTIMTEDLNISEVTTIEFINLTGVEMKFALSV